MDFVGSRSDCCVLGKNDLGILDAPEFERVEVDVAVARGMSGDNPCHIRADVLNRMTFFFVHDESNQLSGAIHFHIQEAIVPFVAEHLKFY